MLRALRITNFAVIESVTVPFERGLNVLTGETGAGKSILVDAILLVRGARAQGDVIRAEAEMALVEAVFDVLPAGPVHAVLDAAGLRADNGQLVVRRELQRAGRHRAFVNDSPVTVALLERLGDLLVDVHGQHEHQRLREPSAQLELLDRYAAAEELAARVGDLVGKYREAQDELERIRTAERDRAQRQDLLRFQVTELNAARLRPGEEEELRIERQRLHHAERIAAALDEAMTLLHEDTDAAAARTTRAIRLVRDLGQIDPALAAPAEALEGAQAQIDDAVTAIRHLRERIDAEPGRLEAVDDRLDALTRLKRKYGDSEAAMLAFRDAAARELDQLEHRDEILAAEAQRLAELEAELLGAARTLSERRAAAAAALGTAAQREIRALGMARARFEVALEPLPPAAIGPRGLDRIELRLAPNPGEELRPLARVASGGELSRSMLALQAVVAAADRVPTMIFDEIDAGIGGRTASVVADKLVQAARGRQVLCVTHLAQIAACADHHVRVAKSVRGGRTRATVTALHGVARVEEIARMLGGEPVTDTALEHARELLAGAGSRGSREKAR